MCLCVEYRKCKKVGWEKGKAVVPAAGVCVWRCDVGGCIGPDVCVCVYVCVCKWMCECVVSVLGVWMRWVGCVCMCVCVCVCVGVCVYGCVNESCLACKCVVLHV